MTLRIVGGCYEERVIFPDIAQWFGSGLRAAAVLRSLGHDTTLTTAVDQRSLAVAEGTAAAVNVALEVAPRTSGVQFRYVTPVSVPTMHGDLTPEDSLAVDADVVVAFGMLDATWRVTARRLVVDPQGAEDLDAAGLANSSWTDLVIVANAQETRRLGGQRDIITAARELLRRYGARAVVVKRAMFGVTIVSGSDVDTVPSYETPRVYPLGSGDAFTAAFAHAWALRDQPVNDAAAFASVAAAVYCNSGDPQISGRVEGAVSAFIPVAARPVRLYLAAPFFTPAQRWLVDTVRDALRQLDIGVFSPVHDVGWRSTDAVAMIDVEALDSCDGVIALLDGVDPGTVFETGWARARGLPVVGVCSDESRTSDWTMLRGTGGIVTADLSTGVYRAAWRAMQHTP